MKKFYIITAILVILIAGIYYLVVKKTCDFNRDVFCISNEAVMKKDPSICESVTGVKDFCYRLTADSLEDERICEKIRSEGVRESCMRDVNTTGYIRDKY